MTIWRLRFVSLALIVLGLAISLYLLFRHFALVGAGAHGGIDVCSAIFGTGCDTALQSHVNVKRKKVTYFAEHNAVFYFNTNLWR
jgi:hypothetical protein